MADSSRSMVILKLGLAGAIRWRDSDSLTGRVPLAYRASFSRISQPEACHTHKRQWRDTDNRLSVSQL